MHKEATTCNLKIIKEQWVDKLRYKKVKFEKYMEKRKRKLDNIIFQKDQRALFRKLEEKSNRKGQMPMVSLLNSGKVYGKEERIHRTCHGWKKLKCN